MFIFQKQHRQSTPVFLKVGGIDPLVAILNGKGGKTKGGDRGAKQHRGQKCSTTNRSLS